VQRRLVTALSATALSLSLIAGTPVFAQTLGLDASAMSGLAKIGIDTSGITSMTTEQVAQIENILASSETDQQKKMHVQELLKGEATDTGRLGVNQLRSSVSSDLAGLGLDASGVDSLTLSQLGQIENVTASSDSDATKKMRISEIIGNEATETGRLGVRQLTDSTKADLASLGINTENIDTLTLSQLAQIENVMGSSDADDVKRQRINSIVSE
jgi:hypothetical protein